MITKVTELTEWVNSLVHIEKHVTGKIHVCLHPKALDDSIQRPYYPMLTIEEEGGKIFSVLDATKGYWSIKLTQIVISDCLQ